MFCFKPSAPKPGLKKPVLDLEEVIQDCAWELFEPEGLSCTDRSCKRSALEMHVDWNFVNFKHEVLPGSFDVNQSKLNTPKEVCLFETVLQNNSEERQTFDLTIDRTTKSSYEMSITEGYSIGSTIKLKFALPAGTVKAGLEGQQTWSGSVGQTINKEKTLTWSVNSHVTVAKERKVKASLHVQEVSLDADMKVRSTIAVSSAHKKIPVDIKRKKDGRVLDILDIACKDICEGRDNFFRDEEDPGIFYCDTKAHLQAVYGVEQIVNIHPYHGCASPICEKGIAPTLQCSA